MNSGDRRVSRAEVDVHRAVPGQGFARTYRDVVDPEVGGVLGQVKSVGDLVQAEQLVFG